MSPARHQSSCQGDLHPLPELWSETSQSIEQCGAELQLAGKRPPALYHRRDTGAGGQIRSSRERGLRGSRETVGGGGQTKETCVFVCVRSVCNFGCLPLDLCYVLKPLPVPLFQSAF